MGLVLLGTAIGLVAMVGALMVGHPFWLAFLMMPAFGSGSVLILAATLVFRARPQRRCSSHRVRRAV